MRIVRHCITHPQWEPAQVEEIRRMRRQWVTVINAGDVESYARMLTRDAVWIPPGQPAVEGREAIRSWLEPLLVRTSVTFPCGAPGSRLPVTGRWRGAPSPRSFSTGKVATRNSTVGPTWFFGGSGGVKFNGKVNYSVPGPNPPGAVNTTAPLKSNRNNAS